MHLGGLDIATTSGLCRYDGETFRASSFRPKAQRPFALARNEVSFEHEGRVAREWRDHLRPWLVENKIEHLAIEQPLQPNLTIKKPVVDLQANFAGQALRFEDRGGTTFGTIFRIYSLVGVACELAARLNIHTHVVHQGTWRQAFLGVTRAPKDSKDPDWVKKRAMTQCQHLKIDVTNLDAAEAVGVCWWLRGHLRPELAGRADDLFRQVEARV